MRAIKIGFVSLWGHAPDITERRTVTPIDARANAPAVAQKAEPRQLDRRGSRERSLRV